MSISPLPSGSPKVLIVLGTCDGQQYLSQFAESVRKQSYTDWTMLVRDDSSRDATGDMLEEMAAEDRRFVILQGGPTRNGAAKNYAALLQCARDRGAEYVFLADQDDVWLDDKISEQIGLMRSTEAAAGDGTPILAYSDLSVVDARLTTIHRSFFRYAGYNRGQRRPLKTLLAHNFIPGCAMLMNRPLLELAVPLPSSAPMHDWWIALCAATAGQVAFLSQPTVLYRQHEGNAVGVRQWWASYNPLQKGFRQRWKRGVADFARHVEQTKALRCRLQQRASRCRLETLSLLDRYCQLLQASTGVFSRIHGMHQLGIPKTILLRRLLFYACLLTLQESPRDATSPAD